MNPTPNKEDQWYTRRGLVPPEHISHEMTPEDISDKVEPINPRNWHAEGNRLMCDTDMGLLVQLIPTDHIFTGTDAKGLPTFRKV